MAQKRSFNGPEGDSGAMPDPADPFNSPSPYEGLMPSPQSPHRRTVSASSPDATGEPVPQYIPPATMETLLRELQSRR